MPKTGTELTESTPEPIPTLWLCQRCVALISIYSLEIIDLAVCPICCEVTMDSLGSFETILGIAFP
jgi:hypothetical protein